MKPCKIIQLLRSDNSKLFKQAVVLDNKDNEQFIEGLKYALTPLITYGTKDVPAIIDHYRAYTYNEELSESTWPRFKELLDKLSRRELTGHAARDAIIKVEGGCCSDTWNDWYRPILLKDFKAGFSERTVNKMIPKTIPIWGCMLAHDGTKNEKTMAALTKTLVEYKYDGIRCIAIVQNNSCTLYSRNGKILTNFPHIEEEFAASGCNNMMFDGEIMSENFQELMKQVYRKTDVDTTDAYFAVFDQLPLDEYNAGKGTLPQLERKNKLALANIYWSTFGEISKAIRYVKHQEIDFSTDEGQAAFKAMNKKALAEGYEGLMIKPSDGLYVNKRSKAWLKIKPVIEVTLTVMDVEEGQGKFEGTTGALVCEGVDDDVLIGVNVGSGLSDEMRESIWNNKDSVIGQLVEIRADAITQAESGEYSLRFPRFKTFRGFEVGEKL